VVDKYRVRGFPRGTPTSFIPPVHPIIIIPSAWATVA